MGQDYQKWDKILDLLFEYPDKEFTIREISKKVRIPHSTVQRYIVALKAKGLIKENKANQDYYFKFMKYQFITKKIVESGLISYLAKLTPSCIILFGSAQKGEYVKESDIDIYIETTNKQELKLDEYEKKIGHKIQLFIEPSVDKLPENLRNNIINGIKLFGYLKIK